MLCQSRNLQSKYKCTEVITFYFLLSSSMKICICSYCWTINAWICCCIIACCFECAWLCCVKILKTSFDWRCCWIIASRNSVLSSCFNFNSFSRNSLSCSNFSLRNEKVSLLLLRYFFSDHGPSFTTCCDSFRFFIAISHISRAFCLSASARVFYCSIICSCFASLSLLRSTKSCSRVSYSVGSAPDNFFSLLFWAENFFKRFVTLSLTALAVKRIPSVAFKVVATFCYEVPRSRLPDLFCD